MGCCTWCHAEEVEAAISRAASAKEQPTEAGDKAEPAAEGEAQPDAAAEGEATPDDASEPAKDSAEAKIDDMIAKADAEDDEDDAAAATEGEASAAAGDGAHQEPAAVATDPDLADISNATADAGAEVEGVSAADVQAAAEQEADNAADADSTAAATPTERTIVMPSTTGDDDGAAKLQAAEAVAGGAAEADGSAAANEGVAAPDKAADGGDASEADSSAAANEGGAAPDAAANGGDEAVERPVTAKTDVEATAARPDSAAAVSVATPRRPIRSPQPQEVRHLTQSVSVALSDGSTRTLSVEVETPPFRKPFLGGFRNPRTKLEYHNASSQTYVRVKKIDGKARNHRAVQVKQTSSGSTNDQQTSANSSTQMTKIGVFVDPTQDATIVPRPYFTADEWHARRVRAVIVLQKHLRRVYATTRTQALRERKAAVEAALEQKELDRIAEEEREWQHRIDRRVNPRSQEDFELLYRGLEVWRLEEMEKITGEAKEAQTDLKVALLRQQCSYLGAIDQLRNEANKKNRASRIKRFFDQSAAAREWVDPEYGKVNRMDSLKTLRARELREVYHALGLTELDMDERLDILLHVKLVVEEFDAKLTREIVQLLNREADLLLRGTKKKNLLGLRQRIRNLFLQFCEDPEYNPIAEQYLSKHRGKEFYQENIIYDPASNKYLDSSEFDTSTVQRSMGQSQKAKVLKNIATTRNDYSQHRRILKAVQDEEIARGYTSNVAFLMTVEDVVYLIETIWRAQSALSQEKELFRLSLARWDRNEEWSPWNCVLLTRQEAETHDELQKLQGDFSSYSQVFVRKVKQKQLLARSYYRGLVEAQKHKVNAEDVNTFVDADGSQIVRDTNQASAITA